GESYAEGPRAAARPRAACRATGTKRDVFLARARRYHDSLDAALTPAHIPAAVFHNVIGAFRDNVGVWHRYWRARRRALGLNVLREFDARAPLAPRVEVDFQQAGDWIPHGL